MIIKAKSWRSVTSIPPSYPYDTADLILNRYHLITCTIGIAGSAAYYYNNRSIQDATTSSSFIPVYSVSCLVASLLRYHVC